MQWLNQESEACGQRKNVCKLWAFGWGTKVCVQNLLEPSSSILRHYHLNRGSMLLLTSQDNIPSLVVYAPEPIRAVFSIDRNEIGCYDVRIENN